MVQVCADLPKEVRARLNALVFGEPASVAPGLPAGL
jgi:hypothetical protein